MIVCYNHVNMTVISNLKKNFISFRTNQKPSNQPEIVQTNLRSNYPMKKLIKTEIVDRKRSNEMKRVVIEDSSFYDFGVYV